MKAMGEGGRRQAVVTSDQWSVISFHRTEGAEEKALGARGAAHTIFVVSFVVSFVAKTRGVEGEKALGARR